MISTYKQDSITWVDLENPTHDEVKKIAEQYGLNPDVAQDLLSPTIKPLVDEHPNYVYLVLHFPIIQQNPDGTQVTEIQEMDFILGKDFIITNRYSIFDSLIEFSKRFTVNTVLNKNQENIGYIFYEIVRGLYEDINNRLEYIHELLKTAEKNIFAGQEKKMVIELSKLNRLLLHYSKATAVHSEVFNELVDGGSKIYDKESVRHFKNIHNDYAKLKFSIKNLRDYTTELRSTNDSLLSSKQNEIMKFLTIMAFITFPMSIVANLFGMNTVTMPLVGMPHDFWIVVAIMTLSTLIIFVYIKFKKWF